MKSKWNLILVNRDYPLPKDFQVELTALKNGEAVDARIYPALMELLREAEGDGIVMYVAWGHRSYHVQELLMDVNVKNRIRDGLSVESARIEAEKFVAASGNSEHQLGLAVDFNADTTKTATSQMYEWLASNSYKYGFILRYPKTKVDITKYNYEPWHFRYVGIAEAKEIYEKKLCLEEYLGL